MQDLMEKKCKVIRIGRRATRNQYTIIDPSNGLSQFLETSDLEREHGVIIYHDLKPRNRGPLNYLLSKKIKIIRKKYKFRKILKFFQRKKKTKKFSKLFEIFKLENKNSFQKP